MRGTPAGPHRERLLRRIIPAHAGNSFTNFSARSCATDHPRACGELDSSPRTRMRSVGSSPRMRGTRTPRTSALARRRIIPAHAGNSASTCVRPGASADHPRACGELESSTWISGSTRGSSPRMRGTQRMPPELRGRPRIIPAHAGNSSPSASGHGLTTDHPRACGELVALTDTQRGHLGSSPRMRGTRSGPDAGSESRRIIPAHAGNSATPPTRMQA